MSTANIILIGLGLAFGGLYFLVVTGRLARIDGTPAPLWNAGLSVLLVGIGTFGIENVRSFAVNLGGIRVGIETQRYEPSPEEVQAAVAVSSDTLAPGQEERAAALVDEAEARGEEERSAADFLVLATEAWRAEDYHSAIEFSLRGIQLEPADPRLLATLRHRLGSGYEELGADELAEQFYRRAMIDDPTFSWPHNNLGLVLKAQGDVDDAIEEFRTAIRLDPDDAPPHHNLGIILRDQGDVDGAVEEFRTAIRLDPDNVPAHVGLGVVLGEQGDADGEMEEYRVAIRLDPDFAVAHRNMGRALREAGHEEEAAAALARAEELEAKP